MIEHLAALTIGLSAMLYGGAVWWWAVFKLTRQLLREINTTIRAGTPAATQR